MLNLTAVRRISLNSAALLAARAAQQGLTLLFTVLVARHLGETGLGQLAFMMAVVYVGNVFSTFGLDTLLLRRIAAVRRTEPVPLAAALALELLLAGLFILAVSVISLPGQTAETTFAVRLYAWSLLPLALTTVTSASLRAYERMDLLLGLTVTTAVLQLGGAALIFWLEGQFLALVLWMLLVQILAAGLGWLTCRRWLPRFTINWRLLSRGTVGRLLRTGVWLALLMVTAVLSQRLGILLLSVLGSEAQTGWFAAAQRLVEVARLLPAAVFGALFPVLARPRATLPASWRTRWLPWGLMAYGLIGAGLLTWLAPWLIAWLFGPGYETAVPVLRVLAWSLLPYLFHLRYSVEMVVAGAEKRVLAVTAASLLLTALLAPLGLAQGGLPGLTAVLVIGEVLLAAGLLAIRS